MPDLTTRTFCSVVIVIAFIIAIGGKAAVAMPSVILAVLPVLLGIYFWITVYTTFTQIKVFWAIHSEVTWIRIILIHAHWIQG